LLHFIQGILRIIYAFYMGLSRDEAPYASIPLNTVLELTPSAFGCSEKVVFFEAVLWNTSDS
jgi:6-phosphofructo-2-kinase/fructose-2,6-biphosphatase 2